MVTFSKDIEESIPRKVTVRDTAPIPLERPEAKDFKKGEGTTFKLRNDPTDSTSPGYDVYVRSKANQKEIRSFASQGSRDNTMGYTVCGLDRPIQHNPKEV